MHLAGLLAYNIIKRLPGLKASGYYLMIYSYEKMNVAYSCGDSTGLAPDFPFNDPFPEIFQGGST